MLIEGMFFFLQLDFKTSRQRWWEKKPAWKLTSICQLAAISPSWWMGLISQKGPTNPRIYCSLLFAQGVALWTAASRSVPWSLCSLVDVDSTMGLPMKWCTRCTPKWQCWKMMKRHWNASARFCCPTWCGFHPFWIHSRSEARLMALMRSADEAKWKRLSAKSKSLGRAWVGWSYCIPPGDTKNTKWWWDEHKRFMFWLWHIGIKTWFPTEKVGLEMQFLGRNSSM